MADVYIRLEIFKIHILI